MAKLNLNRVEMPRQDPKARGKNFNEVALGYNLKQAQEEASRCIQCPKRKCVEGCPVEIDIPAFIQAILDGDPSDGVEPDAWVVDAPALLDRGEDARIRPGQPVAHGRCVWGKIVEVAAHTAVVQAVTEPGYRDLVQIASGPQGILEGTGEPLCRIRLVEATAPVAVGDTVFTAAGRGVLPVPLVYGKIVRLQRPVAATHWDLWMQPAVAQRPERVSVLRIELNPLRTVSKNSARPDD